MAQRHHSRRALIRDGWLGLHHDLLGRCNQRHRRSPVRRIRGQHAKATVPVCARRHHQGGNTGYQLQRREMQIVSPGPALVTAGLAALLGAAVHQGRALFAQALHGQGWAGAGGW